MARASVTITMEDDGSVTVAGPLHEPVLLYGLFAAATQTVADYQKTEKSAIVKAVGPLPKLQ